MAPPGQAVFGRYMVFNLASVVACLVVTSANQQQLDIDNVQENSSQVMNDYAIGDQVYVEISGIYPKLYCKKKVQYIITEVFTNSTVQFEWVQVNDRINIVRLKPPLDE